MKFNKDWLHLYNWLAYQEELDGAFPITCVFFGRRIDINSSKMEKLMTSPVTDQSSVKNKLNLHSLKLDVHKTAFLTKCYGCNGAKEEINNKIPNQCRRPEDHYQQKKTRILY